MKKIYLAMMAGAFAASATSAMAIDMTIVSWGGAYLTSQQNAYHDPFMANNPDVNIINDNSSGEATAKLRAMKEAGNLSWDLVDVEAADAIRLCDEGLAEPINHDEALAPAPDGTPASADFGDMIISECFIPQIVFSTAFGYRTDLVSEAPTSVCDVFDLEKFPGKRSLPKRPVATLEWALLCDGVAKADIYDALETDEGVARALAKLDTIKDHVLWWAAGSDTPQWLADGEIVMGSTFNGRLFALIEEQKQPVAMLWDAQYYDIDGWIVPTGLTEERKKLVMDYLYFATDTQRLADQAKYISYGPARKSSAPLVDKHATLGIEMAPHMPTDPNNAHNTFLTNYVWWADHRDDLDAKFQAWLAK